MSDLDNNLGPEMDPEEEEKLRKERRKARKARRSANESGPGEGEMNLTALMDVLTIMLVFLIKNYSTSPVVNLSENLKPPESSSTIDLKEAITVTVTQKEIQVGDKVILSLANGKIPPEALVKNEPLKIGALYDELAKSVDFLKMVERRGGARFEGNLLVVGDRSIDYELLSSVLYTAGQAELANYRFVTIAF